MQLDSLLRALLLLAMLANAALAAWLFDGLPTHVPIHFDAAGRPDAIAPKSGLVWFALPALGTVIGAVFGFVLPRTMAAMARTNSPWLNVPNKKAFAALPPDARERAVRSSAQGLIVLAIAVQVLLGWIVFGSAKVAVNEWRVLPPWPSYTLIATVIACAVALAFVAHRAVKREVEAHSRATRSSAAT